MTKHKLSKNMFLEKKNPFGSSVDHDVTNIINIHYT